jgi:hypothetical protein
MFQGFKQCLESANIVRAEKTTFEARKQCLKPPNNEKTEKTLFGANLAQAEESHRSGGAVSCVAALIPSAAMAGRIPF